MIVGDRKLLEEILNSIKDYKKVLPVDGSLRGFVF